MIWTAKSGWLFSGIFAIRIGITNHLGDLFCNGAVIATGTIEYCREYAEKVGKQCSLS